MAGKGSDYPRHPLEKALRIPKGILEQNAGKECSDEESANYIGVKYNKGPFSVELNSAIKFGLLKRPESGKVTLTEIARKILKPTDQNDKIEGFRSAIMKAPVVSDVYKHYRGENLPDDEFFNNALSEKFKVPEDKIEEFKSIFFESLNTADLLIIKDEKQRVIDVTIGDESKNEINKNIKKLEKEVKISKSDRCFVMMPFSEPINSYYEKVFKPGVEKAGLMPIRADDEIFATGKIIDQIWMEINNAKVLIAELSNRNPNVFYELGIAHALKKPVVLVSSNDQDVPFDLRHIRVIYYDMSDPFWGVKLIDKIAETTLNVIKTPEDTIIFQ